MKKYLLIFMLTFSTICTSQINVLESTAQNNYQRLDALIGKEFWIKFNPTAERRKEFKNEAKTHRLNYNSFYVSKDEKFSVVGWELDYQKVEHLKIKFNDGKIAYLEIKNWHTNIDVLPDLFNGYEYKDSVEYFFVDEPSAILLKQAEKIKNWNEKVALEKRQAEQELKRVEERAKATHYAKGGVSIGMTKDRVLKSNWGKPIDINRTTTSRGVREQWFYGGKNYLYFENGILTTIQN